MMAQPHVAHGFIVACFPRKIAIGPKSGSLKTCSDTAGDFPGRTTAASFTTVLPRVRMEHRGVSARSWGGGMRKRKNGRDWTIRTTRRTLRQQLPMLWTAESEWWLWAEHVRSRFIPMEWDGFTSPVV